MALIYERWLDRKKLDDAAWLAARKNGLGGSEAAAVAGLNPYESPLSVYYNKIGQLEDKESTEGMRQGKDIEEYVASRFTELTQKRVRKCNYLLRSKKHPFMLADLDRVIDGEDAILECKTSLNYDSYSFEGDDYPMRWHCQCLHYMAVTGAEKCYLAVLVFGKMFRVIEIARKDFEDDITALIELESKFWNDNVLKRIPPEVDGNEATSTALTAIYPKDNGESVDLMGYEKTLERLAQIKREMATLSAEEEQCKNEIKAVLGEASTGEYGSYKVSWKYSERNTLDGKALKAAHPEIYEQFVRTSSSRTFTFKETK